MPGASSASIEQLNELHAAEEHSAEVLPQLAEAASSPELAAIFRVHGKQTGEHVSRLDRVFKELGVKPRPRARAETAAMKGLYDDCMKLARSKAEPHVRDAALIAVAQHVEHDEIAGYGCARTWADLLGHESAATELRKTLADERKADTDLTRLAESLNKAALSAASA